MSKTLPLISFVIPAYNEEDNVVQCHAALAQLAEDLKQKYDVEFVFTDNRSTDKTFALLQKLAKDDKRVRAFRFARNFGYQRSILTGYRLARGDAAIQFDADLQDPPAVAKQFIAAWEKGAQVVYGIRESRKEGAVITCLRKIFYRLIDKLSEHPLPHDAGDFRLVDRAILEQLRGLDDAQPYLRGSIATMGFTQVGIPYSRNARERGVTKFSWKALFGIAFDGILNHSIVPLRFASFTGMMMAFATFVAILGYAAAKLFFNVAWPAGFATTTVLILFSLSLNALFLGIIGEYIGRIYRQVKKEPTSVIAQRVDAFDA